MVKVSIRNFQVVIDIGDIEFSDETFLEPAEALLIAEKLRVAALSIAATQIDGLTVKLSAEEKPMHPVDFVKLNEL